MRTVGKYVPLSPVTPLIHRCGGPPSPEGKVKSFFTELLEPICNDFYFFGRKSVDSRAQMCYDDAIQEGMCL